MWALELNLSQDLYAHEQDDASNMWSRIYFNTPLDHLRSPRVFVEIRVAQSLVFYVVFLDCYLHCPFVFDHPFGILSLVI